MTEFAIHEKMGRALKLAEKIWESAEMPHIFKGTTAEAGKVALTILACKIYDEMKD